MSDESRIAETLAAIEAATNADAVEAIRIEALGKQGWISQALKTLGKAGRSRWLGRKPVNRGVTMNPVDHPHGGGEGRTSGGRHPVTPWGKPTKGKKTRSNKSTDKFIVRSRHVKKGR